nr:hypothetical protein [Tanacetum cinerariifolium]
EPASPVRDVSEGEACPTESGFIADQDRATIAKSSTLPHESAPRVTSPAADEGSMQHTISELTALYTSLQRQYSELLAKFHVQEDEIVRLKERVQVLEDREGVAAKQSGDDAPIKGRSINKGEAAAKRISNDSEEIARVLTSTDAATVLAGGIDVPTGSGFIPTAGPPATVISTGSQKKKLQEQIDAQVARELEEQQEKEDMRMNEQIARDVEVARIHAEEDLQGMIDSLDKSNETIAKFLQEYQDFASELPLEKKIELISDLVKYQDNYSKVEDFIPMGSKEETKWLKRKGLNLDQEQEMMQLVPIEDVYVQALKVKHSIIDWKQLDREDLNQLWALVKEYLSIKPAISEKEMELWVELKRMYEPDPEDQLQRDLHASRKGLSYQKGFSTCDDQLQASDPDLSFHQIKPSVTNEGTGIKPGVPNVTKKESKRSDEENDSDDKNTQSDSEKGLDSEHETDKNESNSKSDQEENEEEIEDDEEEEEHEFVRTPSNDYDDETKISDKAEDIPHTDEEIVSPMDVHVHHEVPSKQTPIFLTVPVSVITESLPIYSTVISQSIPSFTPPSQSTHTPPPTTNATNPPSTLPEAFLKL